MSACDHDSPCVIPSLYLSLSVRDRIMTDYTVLNQSNQSTHMAHFFIPFSRRSLFWEVVDRFPYFFSWGKVDFTLYKELYRVWYTEKELELQGRERERETARKQPNFLFSQVAPTPRRARSSNFREKRRHRQRERERE